MGNESMNLDYGKLFAFAMQTATNKFIASAMPTEEQSDFILKLLRAANKHGVSTQKMLEIFSEFAEEDGSNG